jgi:ectoine hydroxylase-related dioxygenase (phytanoyl-CoA dioxygenase family)
MDDRLQSALERDGYAIIDDFLSPSDIAQLFEVFRAFDSPVHRRPFGASMHSGDFTYRAAVDRAIKAVLEPRALRVLTGHRLCFTNFLVKEPQSGDQGTVELHQDPSLVDETRYQSISIWAPLADTDLTSGCLHVVPGSHRFNTAPRPSGGVSPYRALDPVFQRMLQPVPIKAGSAMIHSQMLFHGSPPNRGTAPRVVAGGFCVPREAQLYCYYRDPASPGKLEVFEIDDLFYTRHTYATRPQGVPHVRTIDYRYEPITEDRLRRAYAGA